MYFPPGNDSSNGTSGYSGYSGIAGTTGSNGISGYSGYSGSAGATGTSGYSGYSGISGYSGYSGKSGYSGTNGSAGATGTSGYSGYSGTSGYSGYSGKSGYSGISGYSGATPSLSGYLPLSGGTMTGNIDLAGETLDFDIDSSIQADGSGNAIVNATSFIFSASTPVTMTNMNLYSVDSDMDTGHFGGNGDGGWSMTDSYSQALGWDTEGGYSGLTLNGNKICLVQNTEDGGYIADDGTGGINFVDGLGSALNWNTLGNGLTIPSGANISGNGFFIGNGGAIASAHNTLDDGSGNQAITGQVEFGGSDVDVIGSAGGVLSLGDINGVNNGTQVQIDDSSGTISIMCSTLECYSNFTGSPVQINNVGVLQMLPGAAPGSPAEGMMYWNSTSHTLQVYNGSAWKTVTVT